MCAAGVGRVAGWRCELAASSASDSVASRLAAFGIARPVEQLVEGRQVADGTTDMRLHTTKAGRVRCA